MSAFGYSNIANMVRLHNSHKLITKEDPMHIHKTLGVICLVNYGYRYYLLFTTGTMHLDNPIACYLMCAHAMLSISSLIYHIPSKRNKIAPMIYPEYRQHSILFAMRSVICFFLTYNQCSIFYKMATCYGTMLLADFISSRHQNAITTTMRNMPFDVRIHKKDQESIILMQSSQQIGATLFMFGNLDSCFTPLYSIQIAAFLMTLVRKNIIDTNVWHILYNTSLWTNVFCFYSLPISYVILQPLLFQLFYYWRFSFDKVSTQILGNKYVGWTFIFALLYCYERNTLGFGYALFPEYTGKKWEKNSLGYDYRINEYVDMLIRRTFIGVYLITQMYRSKGLLVAFQSKTG